MPLHLRNSYQIYFRKMRKTANYIVFIAAGGAGPDSPAKSLPAIVGRESARDRTHHNRGIAQGSIGPIIRKAGVQPNRGSGRRDASAALRPPVPVDHGDGPVRRENSTFLPGADLTEMLAGKVERAVRLIEQRICTIVVGTVARGDAEAVRHAGPGDRQRLLELAAAAGMQCLDRGATRLDLLAQRSFRQLVGVLAVRVGAEQNSLCGEEAVARVPHQRGRTFHEGNSPVDLLVVLPEPARLPGDL